jgi:ATP-dependent DNA helicase DinG
VIEVEVHQQLRAFLRTQEGNTWPHHLTVARLVARALRLQRSTLIQVSSTAAYQGMHRLSYLASLLLWPGPVILVATAEAQQLLCHVELPKLQDWMQLSKPVYAATTWPGNDFCGILLLSPQDWLSQHLSQPCLFPDGVPLVIDGAENLDILVQNHLTQAIALQDWNHLMWAYPAHTNSIRDARVTLTHHLFQHPPNPYGCVMMDQPERAVLGQLLEQIDPDYRCPARWRSLASALSGTNNLLWADIDRQQGCFTLKNSPIDLAIFLSPLWEGRTTILLDGTLDLDPQAELFRLQMGLGDLTCVQFATDRQNEALSLYLPDGLPMPNTPEFVTALIHQLHRLLTLRFAADTFSVLVVDDLPLKTQIASVLAAEFGSRVKVERTDCTAGNILITGWEFWNQFQRFLPHPNLLAIATLPFPSLENPKVAGRVAYYKQLRQDWFRLYLLPEALRILQKAIAPLRVEPSLLALLDNRVLHRSYGKQILSVLSPYARLNYLDESVLIPPQCSV